MRTTRRHFLGSTARGGLVLGGAWAGLSQLRPVSAAEAKLDPALVRADVGLESTVRLLEETPRERLIEEVATRVKNGLPYREVLAALLLAGVRNVQPRPAVGFKFHAVLVINSAHLASLASPDADRWLPIFWAIDRFKSAQMETLKTSGWRMGAVDEPKVPAASRVRNEFFDAMDSWDEARADAAAAGLARHAGRNEAFESFALYGARDFRDIGHKAIYVANSFRTLECIGWQNAEPVLRSLAYALLKYDGPNPSKVEGAPDKPFHSNVDRATNVRHEWLDGAASPEAVSHLLSVLRSEPEDKACDAVVEALNKGVSPASVWDAILAAAGELLMRKTGIVTLHSVTSANALRFAYETSGDKRTRLLMLLQAAAFVPLFRAAAGKLAEVRVDQLEAAAPVAGPAGVDEIFTTASHDRAAATRKALGYLENGGDVDRLMSTARRLVFLKGNDAHDYKFSSAVLEDYYHVSPQWRNRYLATSLAYLPDSGRSDNALVGRIRTALGG